MQCSCLLHLCYTSSIDLICYVLYFACRFMNLKHYFHQCLSRIISWYCSKVNTILTSKVLYTKMFFTLTHLYERELLECMYSLLFSLPFKIYILSYTRPFSLYMTKHAGQMNYITYSSEYFPFFYF